MDPLRLIILLIGLVVIAGIYLRYREPASKSKPEPDTAESSDDDGGSDKVAWLDGLKTLLPRRKHAHDEPDHRIGPQISMEDVESLGLIKVHSNTITSDELAEGMHIAWDSMTPVAPQDELLIVFTVLAHSGEVFPGKMIRQAAQQAGFEYGDMHIFHYYADRLSDSAPAVCSFANIVQPGHFEMIDQADFTSPGISLFAQLPGPLEAREAFKELLGKAHMLADLLGGELCDETRSILTEQSIGHIKEKVEAFRFKQQMAAMKQRRHER